MNNFLLKAGLSIKKFTGRTAFKINQKSPEILLGVGIATFVGTVVAACNASLKADDVLEYHKKKMKDIHEAKRISENDSEVEYDEDLYRRDLTIQYTKTCMSFVRLYVPAIALGAISIGCIIASRNIAHRRYLGVLSAYNGLSLAFDEYRKRVVEEEGELKDRHYRYGTSLTTEEVEMTENGEVIKKTEATSEDIDSSLVGSKDTTARFFDSSNDNWDPNPSFSLMWLRAQEKIMNDLLHTHGHVFLNEVYDALGFDHTPEGAVLGWIEGEGDGYVDFGLIDPKKEDVRRFVNGKDNVIMLEFNHDGPIWNKI